LLQNDCFLWSNIFFHRSLHQPLPSKRLDKKWTFSIFLLFFTFFTFFSTRPRFCPHVKWVKNVTQFHCLLSWWIKNTFLYKVTFFLSTMASFENIFLWNSLAVNLFSNIFFYFPLSISRCYFLQFCSFYCIFVPNSLALTISELYIFFCLLPFVFSFFPFSSVTKVPCGLKIALYLSQTQPRWRDKIEFQNNWNFRFRCKSFFVDSIVESMSSNKIELKFVPKI
jgi:hypothetical protein